MRILSNIYLLLVAKAAFCNNHGSDGCRGNTHSFHSSLITPSYLLRCILVVVYMLQYSVFGNTIIIVVHLSCFHLLKYFQDFKLHFHITIEE